MTRLRRHPLTVKATPERNALEERRIREAWRDVLDLHGLDREAAAAELDRWVNRLFCRGAVGGKVICGFGRGILLEAMSRLLAEHQLVEAWHAEGACLIVAFVPRCPGDLR